VSADTPERLDPGRVAELLRGEDWRLTGGGVTGSTNDDAKALARAGEPGGAAVLATGQTAGRGRFDRTWESPGGGVYISALLRPGLSPAGLAGVTQVVGVAVVRALQSLDAALLDTLKLKWPNDVMARGRKVAGILVESSVARDTLEWLVVGVGLNVLRRPGRVPETAASLDEFVSPDSQARDPELVAAAVLDLTAEYLALMEREGDGLGHLLPDYVELSADLGREVTVRDGAGVLVVTGTVTGFDGQGRLLVDGEDGPHAVAGGDVTLRG
jgi:BirA family biotin operon repressor/biotin-[acetyl-CoA-carboxylase] ligase